MNSWSQKLHNHRHGMLLLALLAMGFSQPRAQGFISGLLIYDTVLSLVLLCVLLVVFRHARDRSWAMLAAAPAIVGRWAGYFVSPGNQTALLLSHQLFVTAFLALAVTIILRRIFSEQLIAFDHILGSVCGYILAGIAWGSCFFAMEMMHPGSFHAASGWEHQEVHAQSSSFINYSLAVLTGAPGSDITPALPAAQMLTWTEALFGQFYLAIVVAQLVSQMMLRPREPPAPDEP